MPKRKDNRPLTYKLASWYAFIFSAVFLIYGGVKIILGVLDRNYDELGQPIIFGLIGIALISVAFAYKELKTWGWYGLVAINSLVILLALFGFSRYENIILIILSGLVLYFLLTPQTKQYVFKRQ
jgi:hypothetical protein